MNYKESEHDGIVYCGKYVFKTLDWHGDIKIINGVTFKLHRWLTANSILTFDKNLGKIIDELNSDLLK